MRFHSSVSHIVLSRPVPIYNRVDLELIGREAREPRPWGAGTDENLRSRAEVQNEGEGQILSPSCSHGFLARVLGLADDEYDDDDDGSKV